MEHAARRKKIFAAAHRYSILWISFTLKGWVVFYLSFMKWL